MYSRKIVGYAVTTDLKAAGAIRALQMAIRQAKNTNLGKTIHHSDRGIQYCCHDYTHLLSDNNILISMTENSDPLENSIAERINLTIKDEFMDDYKSGYPSMNIAIREIKRNIHFYNQIRPHRSIEMLTPKKAHSRNGTLKRKWKNYYSSKLHK